MGVNGLLSSINSDQSVLGKFKLVAHPRSAVVMRASPMQKRKTLLTTIMVIAQRVDKIEGD